MLKHTACLPACLREQQSCWLLVSGWAFSRHFFFSPLLLLLCCCCCCSCCCCPQADVLQARLCHMLGRSLAIDTATAQFYLEDAGGDMKTAMEAFGGCAVCACVQRRSLCSPLSSLA